MDLIDITTENDNYNDNGYGKYPYRIYNED